MAEMTSRLALIMEIQRCFPDANLPEKGIADWEGIPEGEDEANLVQLRGRSWRSVWPDEISQLPACFLTSEALAILLPAFMILDLSEHVDHYRVSEMCLTPESRGNEGLRVLMQRLSVDQLKVVILYLQFAADEGDATALIVLRYWLERFVERSQLGG